MKFVLFWVDLVIDGADFSPFLPPRSGGLGFLLLLLVIGLSMAGKDKQLGMPAAFNLGLDDIAVALSVLAGVIVAWLVLAIAGVFSASFFCDFLPSGLFEGASFLLFARLLVPVPALCFRERGAMADKKKNKKCKWWESFNLE